MYKYFDKEWLKTANVDELKAKESEIQEKINLDADMTWSDLHETYANEFFALDSIEEELMLRPLNGQVNVVKEDGQVIVSVNRDLVADIYKLIRDWPDIISNAENLKLIADLNMCSAEKIVDLTNAIYAMVSIVRKTEEGKEGIIRILP